MSDAFTDSQSIERPRDPNWPKRNPLESGHLVGFILGIGDFPFTAEDIVQSWNHDPDNIRNEYFPLSIGEAQHCLTALRDDGALREYSEGYVPFSKNAQYLREKTARVQFSCHLSRQS